MAATEAFAPAKLNLTLHVTGQRANGYHLLDSLVVFADVGDRLSLTPGPAMRIDLSGPFATGVPTDARNLVWRAAEAAAWRGHIALEKNLPHGAGIGGGSSDAAAVLRAIAGGGRCRAVAWRRRARLPVGRAATDARGRRAPVPRPGCSGAGPRARQSRCACGDAGRLPRHGPPRQSGDGRLRRMARPRRFPALASGSAQRSARARLRDRARDPRRVGGTERCRAGPHVGIGRHLFRRFSLRCGC